MGNMKNYEGVGGKDEEIWGKYEGIHGTIYVLWDLVKFQAPLGLRKNRDHPL